MMRIRSARRLEGLVTLPGDKSISHRAALLSAIAEGESRVSNYAESADCLSTLSCLEQLGVNIVRHEGEITIVGRGKGGLTRSDRPIDCGNSGTTMRLLAGILAGQRFESAVTGDESLRARPMERIADPLRRMGADVATVDGKAPLHIKGRYPLDAIEYTTPVASAQIKSCLLIAGLFASGRSVITETTQTRDHTERILNLMGSALRIDDRDNGKTIAIDGDTELEGCDIDVPGDISAAAFFIVAAAALNDSDIEMRNVGINPSRSAILDVLTRLGVWITITGHRELCNEPRADIKVQGGLGSTVTTPIVRGAMIANLIDEIPILAVLGTQLESGLEIRDAAELRVKETDRIAAVCTNLRRMGAGVMEYEDGFAIQRSRLVGAQLDSFGDHRIAMSFAIAGLLAEGETVLEGSDCASVSFPNFFDNLESVAVR